MFSVRERAHEIKASLCIVMQRHASHLPSQPRPAERSGQGYGEEPSESEAGPQAVQAAEQARQVCDHPWMQLVTDILVSPCKDHRLTDESTAHTLHVFGA